MNVIEFYSFSDELIKIAGSKWKAMMRAGELLPENVKRLEQSGLLDYGKEVAGLNRGTTNIFNKLGITEHISNVRGSLKNILKSPSKENLRELAKNIAIAGGSMASGGARFNPLQGNVLISKGVIKRTFKNEDPALVAVLRRHEADEARSFLNIRKHPKRFKGFFEISRQPRTKTEKAQVNIINKAKDFVEKNPEYVKNPNLRMNLNNVLNTVRKDKIVTGRHVSPWVIEQESKNIATLPESVKKTILPFREGEIEAMSPQGFEYGKWKK